jgi:chromosome segregation ATPase
MSRSHKALTIIVVATLGLWGCAQGKGRSNASHEERIKSLEAKVARLEGECHSLTVERDRAQKKVAELDRERERLLREVDRLAAVVRERDDLKVLVATRTAERNAYQTQFEELRKGIRSLLGRAESALTPAPDLACPTHAAGPGKL